MGKQVIILMGFLSSILFSSAQKKVLSNQKDILSIKSFIYNTPIHSMNDEQRKKYYKKHGATIECCLPSVFDSYFKILHPFELAVNLPDKLVSEAELEKRVGNSKDSSKSPTGHENDTTKHNVYLKITMRNASGEDVDLAELSKRKEEWKKSQTWEPVSWETICRKYNIPYTTHIHTGQIADRFDKIGYPYNISFPSEGLLPVSEFKNIIEFLSKDSINQQVEIYMVQPHSNTTNAEDIIKCNIGEVSKYFPNGFIGYLTNVTRDWLLYTDTDFQYSLFGCSKKIAENLLKEQIEVLKCQPKTKL